jgi:hypothetical protein
MHQSILKIIELESEQEKIMQQIKILSTNDMNAQSSNN